MTILQGASGNDDLRVAADDTAVNGNGGIDTIDLQDSPVPVTVNLVDGTVTAAGWLAGVVSVTGATQIYGGWNGGTLTGGANTTYIAAPGGDTTIYGGAAGANIVLGAGNDTVHAGAGNDEIYAGVGANTIDGGGGYNGVSYSADPGPVAVDLYAGAWHDNGASHDGLTNIVNIQGSSFASILKGDWQDNIITGGAGADTIEGREGNDTLTGGGGGDTFIMDTGVGHTVITDFTPAGDRIDLTAFATLHSLADVLAVTSQQAGGAVIALGGGALTLQGVSMGSLTAADFAFATAATPPGPTVGPGVGGSPQAGGGALNGGAGSDWLQGQGGNDTLHGAAGSDYLDGGAGLNTALYDGAYRQYAVGAGGATVSGGPEGGTDDLVNIQRVQFIDGYLAFSPTDTAAEVYRLYEATLNRAPDPGGLANWVHYLNSGASLQSAADGFVASAEFQAYYGNPDNAAFATLLYHNVLHRDPDPAGFSNLVNALNAGMSHAQAVLGFTESPEDIADLAAPVQQGQWVQDTAAAQAARLYDTALARLPDAPGLVNLTHYLESGGSLLSAAAGFVDSPEFQADYGSLDNGAFATLLYHNVLHRDPDPPGFSNLVNALNAGMSRAQAVLGFSESPEHIGNTAPHIDYGIWLA